MDQVEGLHSILLNGRPIAGVSPATASYEIGLDPSQERNLLVLEIEPPPPGAAAAETQPEWGSVALVIRSIDAPAGQVST
jgi:hypothetical protein